ncbi:hypothetical protein L596_002694 [Steinernema carpocapsae]|uniref:Uncharacterized protein n=1 Tax=Steinernema carpocapsae TaxID=34508 RepID=A0A4U8UQG9_STECR|nr:hypothetical protein L596_002694 [Steinernema carpocapsae]
MRLTSAIPKAELQREIEQPSAPPDYRIIVRKVGSFLETSLPADLLSGTILEKIDVLESKLVNSRAKLEKLQKHLASAEESRDMNIDLMEQMSKQMREMGGLLEDRQVQVDSLQKANEELMEELDALSSDRAEKSENEICRTAMLEDELRTKNEESQILQTQVGQLQDALRELSITNDSVENGRREMETKVSEFQVIFDELRGSEGVWQVQLTGLKEEVKRLTQENEMYVKDREADDAEFTTLKDDLNVKINEVENLRLTITDLENDVQNLTTELVNLREENNVFSVRQTLATTSSAIEPTIPQPVDTRELFSGEHAELKRTTSGLLRKENEMLRECVSETDQLHDELAEEVHVMMVLNRDLENAVDALKGEVWALNGKLKACLVEREELLAKWETAGETEMALHDLQKAFNEVVSKKTRDIGTDPLENPDASKEEVQKYRELLANVSEELQTLRGRDMQTVKDVVKEFEKAFMAMQKSAEPLLANSQSLAMRAMSSASHLHLAILAAKLTTKQADNDALFRANAELAHTNVGLQNQLEELQEKLDEALEANDRFIMDGQQQTEEKVAHLSNVIRSLEDRLELTENLNRELEDKCYEAEQMLSSNKQFEELLEVQKQQMRSSGWNEWDNEASDSEGNRGKHGCSKFEECLEKDTIIEEVKGDIEEKKTQTCVDCADKMDEIKKLVMKVAEQEDELNSVKESFEKQLESELAGFAEQLQCTASAVMEEVAKVQEPMKVEGGSDWDDWHSDASAEEEATPSPQRPAQAKCQMCPRKDEDIVELKTAIEEKEQEVSFLKCRKCPDCYSKEDELNDFAFKLIEKDEDMSMLKEKFEAERANLLDQLKQSEALLVTKTAVEAESAAGWDDWNADITEPEAANPKKASIQESCEGCTEKEGVLENLRSEIADVTEKMRLACFSKDDQLTALQLRLTEMDEERNALKESYEKRLAVERVNVGEQLRQANEAAKLQAALELKNDTEENTGWDNWSADGAEAEDCGSPPAQQSCQSCLMKDADLEELQTQKSALGEELTMDRVRHKKQVEDFERQLNEKNQEIRNLSDNFRMRLKADQFKFAEELQQAVEAAKGEERNKKDAGGRKKEGSDWGDWDFDSEETTIAQQKEVPAAHKCQCYALKDADICDLRAALSKKSEDMEAMKKEFDKRLQMEKTKFAEQLKQATSVVATTSKDRTENNDEKLFEMTRQRNEAMKKVAELQKRLRSSQQKRISSVASIASSSASSQQRLNDPHELSLSSFENSTALKPVITRSIQSAYLALVCPDVSLGSDDPLRRRMKK